MKLHRKEVGHLGHKGRGQRASQEYLMDKYSGAGLCLAWAPSLGIIRKISDMCMSPKLVARNKVLGN